MKFMVVAAAVSAFVGSALWAQVRGGGSEWLTSYGDAQRTSWIRNDAAISVEALGKPGFELQWKAKLENQARHLNGLGQGVTANGVTLFVPLSLVTGSSNNVFALDNDTGYLLWQRHFEGALPAPTAACPGGITAAATRLVAIAPQMPTPPRGGGGGGRGAGYRGSVSEPGQGVTVESRGGGAGRGAGAPPAGAAGAAGAGAGAARAGAAGAAAAAGAPGGRGAVAGTGGGGGAQPAGGGGGRGAGGAAATPGIPGAPPGAPSGGFGRPAGVVYVVAADGMLHVLGLPSGKDMQEPKKFLPPNASWSDPVAANAVLFTGTNNRCGDAPNGIWAIDLAAENKPVTSWQTNGGGVVGPIALGTDGMLIAAIGPAPAGSKGYANAIVSVDPKTMELKDWFTDPTAEFTSAPVVFTHGDKDIVGAATKDGRIFMLDAKSLGGATHSKPLFVTKSFAGSAANFAPGALATWYELLPAPTPAPGAAAPAPAAAPPASSPAAQGTRWLLVPTARGITAAKVVESGGKLSLKAGWVSREIASPVTPLIVNGVVFAVSASSNGASAEEVAKRAQPAVLYALNAVDGKELWTSGTAMSSFFAGKSFWSANGQVYVGTFDGTLYAFGFAMERKH